MQFGRVVQPEGIDLSLPDSVVLFNAEKGGNALKVIPGLTTWTSPDYKSILYPEKTKRKDFLLAYTQRVPSLEFNSTHYHIPRVENVHKWVNQVENDRFLFCPKFPQSISHRKRLHEVPDYVDSFLATLQAFHPYLGTPFFQLPYYFKPEDIIHLDKFLNGFPTDIRVAFEFRHPDWFADKVVWENVCDLLASYGHYPLITDTPGRRDVLHMTLTSTESMVRFNGTGDWDYDKKRLNEWADVLFSWERKGMQKVYFFIHQPEIPLSVKSFSWFEELIRRSH